LSGLDGSKVPGGGLTQAQEDTLFNEGRIPVTTDGSALRDLESVAAGGLLSEQFSELTEAGEGHNFALPKLPLPPQSHLKERYHPVVHQMTNLLMRHGKLGAAQRVRSRAVFIPLNPT
jgi:small subunit ribosomal protein S7